MKMVTFARFVARGIALCWRAGKGLFLASTLSSVLGAVVVPLQMLLLAATVDLVAGVAGSGRPVRRCRHSRSPWPAWRCSGCWAA